MDLLNTKHLAGMNAYTSIYVLSSCELRIAALKALCTEENGCRLAGMQKELPVRMQHVQKASPDLVIVDMDMFLAGSDDIASTIDLLKQQAVQVLVLASYLDISLACTAIAHGASGYLLTSTSCQHCLNAFRFVACGGTWLEEELRTRLVEHIPTTQRDDEDHVLRLLSTREYQILQKTAQGETSKDIAQTLCLSESSVRTYWHRVLTKLNAFSKVEAVTRAIRLGILNPQKDLDSDEDLYTIASPRLRAALHA
jgi:DNA-binding NarL/FixJ family response regulator